MKCCLSLHMSWLWRKCLAGPGLNSRRERSFGVGLEDWLGTGNNDVEQFANPQIRGA